MVHRGPSSKLDATRSKERVGTTIVTCQGTLQQPCLAELAAQVAAGIYAETRAKGTPVDDIDILIAGIAQANDCVLVTHNRQHFDRIGGIQIEDWSEP